MQSCLCDLHRCMAGGVIVGLRVRSHCTLSYQQEAGSRPWEPCAAGAKIPHSWLVVQLGLTSISCGTLSSGSLCVVQLGWRVHHLWDFQPWRPCSAATISQPWEGVKNPLAERSQCLGDCSSGYLWALGCIVVPTGWEITAVAGSQLQTAYTCKLKLERNQLKC